MARLITKIISRLIKQLNCDCSIIDTNTDYITEHSCISIFLHNFISDITKIITDKVIENKKYSEFRKQHHLIVLLNTNLNICNSLYLDNNRDNILLVKHLIIYKKIKSIIDDRNITYCK